MNQIWRDTRIVRSITTLLLSESCRGDFGNHGVETLMESLSETAALLYAQYGSLTLSTSELADVLHYGSARALLNAISAERCPVHTFRTGKARVADIRDVAEYLDGARGL